jgi:hypothetical protein
MRNIRRFLPITTISLASMLRVQAQDPLTSDDETFCAIRAA